MGCGHSSSSPPSQPSSGGESKSDAQSTRAIRDFAIETPQQALATLRSSGMAENTAVQVFFDFSASNKWTGGATWPQCMHRLSSSSNTTPYATVLSAILPCLQNSADSDGRVDAFVFGDVATRDTSVRAITPKDGAPSAEAVLQLYFDQTRSPALSGPTSFVPLILSCIQRARVEHAYVIAVIIGDGAIDPSHWDRNMRALALASLYPISFIMVGVGGGKENPDDAAETPWKQMKQLDDGMHKYDGSRDCFQFVALPLEVQRRIWVGQSWPPAERIEFLRQSLNELGAQVRYAQKHRLIERTRQVHDDVLEAFVRNERVRA